MKRFANILFGGLIALSIVRFGDGVALAAGVDEPAQQVVILHGIARSSSHMEPLADYLSARGYAVINLDYPSTDHTLEALVGVVHADLVGQLDPDRTVHFVGYSMGGLMVRALLNRHRPEHLGRVVQLAAPNKGSEVADFLEGNWLYENLFGPAGQQLTTGKIKLNALFGEVTYELGVVAGNKSIDLASSLIIPGDDDGKVSIESTKVPGMKAHVIVPATHTFFPSNAEVHRQTAYFLKYGVFE